MGRDGAESSTGRCGWIRGSSEAEVVAVLLAVYLGTSRDMERWALF